MGYRPKKKIYNLVFDDPEMEGLEVRILGLNTGQMLDVDAARDDGGEEAVRSMLELMADQLVSWNVEDEDERGNIVAIPATLDGVRQQDLDFNMKIIDAWQTAVAGVPAPLDSDSTSGGPSPAVPIPMEPLSLPPESTAVPA